MGLWDMIINVLEPLPEQQQLKTETNQSQLNDTGISFDMQTFVNVDYVEPTVAKLSSRCQMIIMEDNDAVIKMCLKVRAPTLRHVSRTHRIDVDLLLEQVHAIEGLSIKYINTKLQLADIFTKGSFSVHTWNTLCRLLQVGPL